MSYQNINVQKMIEENAARRSFRQQMERLVPVMLFLLASITILTTAGIIFILLKESFNFFKEVSMMDFYTGTVLKPLSKEPAFGILPLLTGTVVSSFIAILTALPIGLMIAIYLSNYAHKKVRSICKPLLEVLAGVPTIVYGFFAFTFVTPLLRAIIPNLEATNILSPGIVMGIMIIPMVASLSEDAMRSVPVSVRDGALALGSTRLEMVFKTVIPYAMSGIVASVVLAISRAIGETMIVTIASGSSKNFTFDVTQSMQTMTAYIVEVTSGDAAAGTAVYHSLYAVALTLFVFTFLMNIAANLLVRKTNLTGR